MVERKESNEQLDWFCLAPTIMGEELAIRLSRLPFSGSVCLYV